MEYKLCKDNGMMICCDFDCRKCANLVYEALTDENKILKKEFDKRDKERDGFFNEIKRITDERNRIHDELKELKKENKELIDKCQELEEQLEWANEDIESLNNKHWDDGFKIVSKNQIIMELEEKCEKLEKEYTELVMENNKLHTINSELIYKNKQLMKTIAPISSQYSYGELSDKIEGLKEDIIRLDKCLSRRPCVKMEREEED